MVWTVIIRIIKFCTVLSLITCYSSSWGTETDNKERHPVTDKTKKIPVILLTNLNQKDEIERGLSLGADDYLIKAHFMPSEVVEKIKKVLGK